MSKTVNLFAERRHRCPHLFLRADRLGHCHVESAFAVVQWGALLSYGHRERVEFGGVRDGGKLRVNDSSVEPCSCRAAPVGLLACLLRQAFQLADTVPARPGPRGDQ